MQIEELLFYNARGEVRSIPFHAGRLNIITGDSRTGKSSLINIIRYLLGGGNPHAPRGPIQQSVAWYGMRARVGQTSLFVGRPAPVGDAETVETMLVVGDVEVPTLSELHANSSSLALRGYLGGLLGIEDNRMTVAGGQTRDPLSAAFVHSLFYCFQGQGEIANPDILFHRQNREWIPQTIRDTLPYFLGAQGAEDLRLRSELRELRRELRLQRQRLRRAEMERAAGIDHAQRLLTEAADVGLLERAGDAPGEYSEARDLLRALLDRPRDSSVSEGGGEFDRLRHRRADVAEGLRDLGEQLRGLEEFARADESYASEAGHQIARLASIGLIPEEGADAACAMCGRPLEDDLGAHEVIARTLARAERRLDLATRDRPRIEGARETLLARRQALRDEAAQIDATLDALAAQDELAARARDVINLQSYVRGRIAQYLDATQDTVDEEFDSLRRRIDQLELAAADLEQRVDVDAVRSRTTSLLRTVSRTMTEWARELELEHAEDGVQIDLDRLTIVADTPQGPAYMDRGEIGSGMNWVGYHLTAYLALQDFFIRNERPVPSFLVLDQPSQAFFPRDRESGGDLDELTDTDREHTRQLYALVHRVVEQLGGRLQVIALDHADFEDAWFAESVVQRWRDGEALIPASWADPFDEVTT
jgi:hypothetical protein